MIGRYKWFVGFLCIGILQNSAWLFGTPKDAAYARFYMCVVPIMIGLSIATVIELWHLVMGHYAGVEIIYRWLIPAVLIVAVAVALATGVDLWGVQFRGTRYHAITLALRYSATVLAFVCGFLAFWMDKFDAVPKNLERHALLLTGYFCSVSAGNLVVNLLGGRNELAGPILAGVVAAFYAMWPMLLTKEGEFVGETCPAPIIPTRVEYDGLAELMRVAFSKRP